MGKVYEIRQMGPLVWIDFGEVMRIIAPGCMPYEEVACLDVPDYLGRDTDEALMAEVLAKEPEDGG